MKYLNVSMMLSIFFPYIQIIPLDSYTQPYPFIFAIAIIFVRMIQNKNISNVLSKDNTIALTGFTAIGLVIFAITCPPYNNLQEYKYLINYVGTVLLIIAIVSILKDDERIVNTVGKYAVITWVSVALIQSLIYPSFLVSIVGVESSGDAVSNMTASGRGVFGLASEPTHHGFFMIILGATLAIRNSPKWLIYLCIFDALFMAKSSSALLCLLVGLIILVAANLGKVLIISSASILGVILFLFSQFSSVMINSDSRMGSLVNTFIGDPLNFLVLDYSVNNRVGGAIASMIYAFENGLVPQGLSHADWIAKNTIIMRNFPWLLGLSMTGPPSGFGIIIYQCGIFGIPFVAWFICQILRIKASNLTFTLSCAAIFVFFCQYNISSPGFALLYSCAIHRLDGKGQIQEGHDNLQKM